MNPDGRLIRSAGAKISLFTSGLATAAHPLAWGWRAARQVPSEGHPWRQSGRPTGAARYACRHRRGPDSQHVDFERNR